MADGTVTRPPAPPYRVGGNLLLLSGQVGVDEEWRPVEGTFQDEARAMFRNVRLQLAAAGAKPEQIVKVTAYLADLADFDAYNQVWVEEFPGDRPARTTIGASLYPPFRVEVDVVAWVESSE